MDSAQTYTNPEYGSSYNSKPAGNQSKWFKITLLVLLALTFYLFKSEWWDKPTLVTVIGEGKIKVKIQKVTLTVGITNLSTSSAQAKIGNDLKVKSLKEIAKKFGIKDADMVLANYKMATVSASTGREVFQGVNNATLTLYDPTKYDSLVTQLRGQNFQNINNIQFTSNNPDGDQKMALSSAIADGKNKAGKVRKQLGKIFVGRLASVTIISESTTKDEISKTASLVFELH